MPVMVVGADSPLGEALIDALWAPDREVRAFVSDASSGIRFKQRGIKVAVGDLSDASHLAAACQQCFTVAFVVPAADDGRELAFAKSRDSLEAAWVEAVRGSGARRVIWVTDGPAPTSEVITVTIAGRSPQEIGAEVAKLDDAEVG